MPGAWGQIGQQVVGNAATGAVGIGIQRIGAKYDRRQQLKTQEAMMGLQLRGNKEMMDYQKMKDLEMWNDTNYEAQMKHIKNAGLNPAMMYGMSGGGGVTTGGSGAGVSGGTAGYVDTTGAMAGAMGIDVAETQLKLAQAKLANTQADKLAGVDTKKTEAETSAITQGITNAKAQKILTDAQTRIANIEGNVKEETQDNLIQKIVSETNQAIDQAHIVMNDAKISDATQKSKILILKAEAIGKFLENVLTEQKTEESKSNVNVNKQQIDKMKQEVAQGWEKLSQSEKIMRVDALIKEYDNMFKGNIGKWRISNPETIARQIDQIMRLEQKDFRK